MKNNIKVGVPALKKILRAYDNADCLLWDHFNKVDVEEGLNLLTIPEAERPEQRTQDDSFFPAIIMLAFTIELGLKILLYQEKRTWSYKHDLKEIFSYLDPSLQQKLKKRVCKNAEINEVLFDQRLHDNKDTFIHWRYFFEREKVSANRKFLSSLKRAIIEELS